MTPHAGPTGPIVLPDPAATRTVVPAPRRAPGTWAGAPTATVIDDTVWLAYRERRPEGDGRGHTTVLARSADGVTFVTVARVDRSVSGAESYERPVLTRIDDGTWRLYLSCATPGTKHWWVECLEAASPGELPGGRRTMVLPGDDTVGVKDPVILRDKGRWHVWYTCHPLTDAGDEDRMTTKHAVSDDGLSWRDHETVLAPSGADRWDARGTRLTAVASLDPFVATYDGRRTAEENWFEVTGLATGTIDAPAPVDEVGPLRSPHTDGAFRYATVVTTPGGATRWYAEQAMADGAHDIVTWAAPD